MQTRSMTGTRPDANRYESSLERDFMELVEAHPDYSSYQAQPVWVPYVNLKGKSSRYPPDGLVRWRSDRPPLLVEIKYRADCAGLWRELRRKFRAARQFAASNGWEFRVLTEEQIRGQRLTNVRFLSGYRSRKLDDTARDAILGELADHDMSIRSLTEVLSAKGMAATSTIAYAWVMVARGLLSIDMEVPITADTVLRVKG